MFNCRFVCSVSQILLPTVCQRNHADGYGNRGQLLALTA